MKIEKWEDYVGKILNIELINGTELEEVEICNVREINKVNFLEYYDEDDEDKEYPFLINARKIVTFKDVSAEYEEE